MREKDRRINPATTLTIIEIALLDSRPNTLLKESYYSLHIWSSAKEPSEMADKIANRIVRATTTNNVQSGNHRDTEHDRNYSFY